MNYFVLFLSLILCAFLEARDIPKLKSRVMDESWSLKSDYKESLETKLEMHERETGNQIVVYVINSLEGENLEEYSLRVAETWKLGQKGKDNGVLLLVSIDDRVLRIEVGYGLEETLTDVLCSRIIRNEITPRFKSQNYEEGITAGVEAIIRAIGGLYVIPPPKDWSHLGPLNFLGEMDPGDDLLPWPFRIGASVFVLAILSVFTYIAMHAPYVGWLVYFFLFPFWSIFPTAFHGANVGASVFLIYAVGFGLYKIYHLVIPQGRRSMKKIRKSNFGGSGSRSSSGGFSRSGGFSGGGGSFGGGGSSGSW